MTTLKSPVRAATRRAATTGNLLVLTIAVAELLTELVGGFAVLKLLRRLLPFAAILLFLLQPRLERGSRRIPTVLVAFLAWACASYLWSADPGASQRRLVDLLLVSVLAWCTTSQLTFEQLHRGVTVLVKLLVAGSFLALLVAPGWSTVPRVDGAPGWHAFFTHKNGLGAFAVLAVVTLWYDRSSRRRLWIGLAVVLAVGSRSSTSLSLLLILLGALGWRRSLVGINRPLQRSTYVWASWVLVGVGIFVLVTDVSLLTSLLGRGSTLSGRTDIWAAVVRAAEARPFHGFGYGGVWEAPIPPTSEIWKELRFQAFHAHSGYLDLYLQVGLVGLGLFLALLVSTMVRAARAGHHGRWAMVMLATLSLNALVESGPFFGAVMLIASFATIAAQSPATSSARPATIRASRSTASRSRNARSGWNAAPARRA